MTAATAAAAPDVTSTAGHDEAREIIGRARQRIGVGDGVLESLVLGSTTLELCDDIATMQVALTDTGVARLSANPAFVREIGVDGSAFVLAHEAFHLLFGHLRISQPGPAAALAREVVINHWVRRSGHRDLPRDADGSPVGIDPIAVHERYMSIVGDTSLDYEAFVATDEVCARELMRIQPPPGRPGLPGVSGECLGGRDASGSVIDDLLEVAVRRAAAGDERLRQQLLDLADATPDAAAWGAIGLEELRGVAARLGDTGFWRHHLRAVIGRLLRPRTEVAYDRKTGWWDHTVLASAGITLPSGTGMPLLPVRRPRRHRTVAVYIDVSGSVPPSVIDRVAQTIGPIPHTDVAWHTFDTVIHPFEPGGRMLGGGGTDFDPIVDHVATFDRHPDAVVVVTDGWAPPVRPPRPDRWIWLIVEDGDDWPARAGMPCVPVALPTT